MAGSVKLKSPPVAFNNVNGYDGNAFHPYKFTEDFSSIGKTVRIARGEGAAAPAAYEAALIDASAQISAPTSADLVSLLIVDVHFIYTLGKAPGTQWDCVLLFAFSPGDLAATNGGTVTML